LAQSTDFVDPPWDAPLDVARVLAAIPFDAQLAGMFFQALQQGAERRGVPLEFPRERYLPFGFYPISEFVPLLVEACGRFYPELSLRQALRRIGSVGPTALLSSTLGKVTLGAAEGVHAAVEAIAKTYPINVKGSRCDVLETKPRSMLLSLKGVPYFLDSHHVGVFEGTLQLAGVSGSVKLRSHNAQAADLLLEW
jgi:uncharacterized protein (TIGR02265 family)